MTVHLIAFPAFRKFPPEARRGIIEALAARYGRLVAAVAGVTILLGVLRGLAGGVFEELTSPYGLTWIAALILAVGIAAFEGTQISPTVGKLIAASGPQQIELLDKRLDGLGAIQLAGFLILFSLMIAMHVGY
jgi:tetrahydromethanopterin S-methyltransferase subunit E